MSELLAWASAVVMLAVAGHCMLRTVRLLRSPGTAHRISRELLAEGAHVVMAVAMAAMLAGWVADRWAWAVTVAFVALAVWLAVEIVVRREPDGGWLCLSSLAMAAMVWATTLPRSSTPAMSSMSSMSSMSGMAGMDMGAGGAGLRGVALWLGLLLSAGLGLWALRRRRPRDAVMGGAMALMLGSML
ncbi:MAG: DUF5134 domain-containing protein [Nocardioides sp.]|uniref:DUF5134 domain-containing protein n=1 Tax=Nocardioides sp. TaxID=35761 RepID=UPI0039E2B03A